MSGRFALPLVTEEPHRVSGLVAVAPVGIPGYKDQLDRITAPVLAIWGEHDRTIPQEQADLLVGSVRLGRRIAKSLFEGPDELESLAELPPEVIGPGSDR